MTAEFEVRPARESDASAIGAVYVDTWRTTYAGIVPDKVLLQMSAPIQAERWRRELARDGQIVFVAADERGRVLGFTSGGPARKGARVDGEIYTLYVDPDAQGGGVGRALVTEVFRAFAGFGWQTAVIWVLQANPARFFYEALGGARVGERVERLWGVDLAETGYVWSDLQTWADKGPEGRSTPTA